MKSSISEPDSAAENSFELFVLSQVTLLNHRRTTVGDEAELLALESLPYSCPIYGLKGSVGHTMASSAGVEMAYGIAGLREGWIPYTSTTTDPVETKHQIILHNILHREQTNFAKLSFGFGGASAGVRISKV